MNVTFCGHSQITKADNIANWLRNVTQDLIEQGATTFYLGGYGEFDSLAASILREQKKKYPQIELVLVLAYLTVPCIHRWKTYRAVFRFLIEIAGW